MRRGRIPIGGQFARRAIAPCRSSIRGYGLRVGPTYLHAMGNRGVWDELLRTDPRRPPSRVRMGCHAGWSVTMSQPWRRRSSLSHRRITRRQPTSRPPETIEIACRTIAHVRMWLTRRFHLSATPASHSAFGTCPNTCHMVMKPRSIDSALAACQIASPLRSAGWFPSAVPPHVGQ